MADTEGAAILSVPTEKYVRYIRYIRYIRYSRYIFASKKEQVALHPSHPLQIH